MKAALPHDAFRHAFAQALLDPVDEPARWQADAWAAQPGFAVYRNTVAKACIDALAANYPVVLRLVGEAWFRGMAAAYLQAEPPRDGRLLLYGQGLPDFVAKWSSASDVPYLGGVAQLDRWWTEAHTSTDAVPVSADDLAALPGEVLTATFLRPHPSARWAWFDEVPVYSLWCRHRESPQADPLLGDITWQGEGALLTRLGGTVLWAPLSRGGVCLLAACSAGRCLSDAAVEATLAEPGLDLADLLALCLSQGALTKE
jgi:hypothetical protein